MNLHYNQNHKYEEIEEVLSKIKKCISLGNYYISLNEHRQENIDFINEYNIRTDKQKNILMNINVEDFCHSLQNLKTGYEHETLYVFVPNVQLFNSNDEKEIVPIYTKFNIIELSSGDKTVVISFHKCNKPIQYLFK